MVEELFWLYVHGYCFFALAGHSKCVYVYTLALYDDCTAAAAAATATDTSTCNAATTAPAYFKKWIPMVNLRKKNLAVSLGF